MDFQTVIFYDYNFGLLKRIVEVSNKNTSEKPRENRKLFNDATFNKRDDILFLEKKYFDNVTIVH